MWKIITHTYTGNCELCLILDPVTLKLLALLLSDNAQALERAGECQSIIDARKHLSTVLMAFGKASRVMVGSLDYSRPLDFLDSIEVEKVAESPVSIPYSPRAMVREGVL